MKKFKAYVYVEGLTNAIGYWEFDNGDFDNAHAFKTAFESFVQNEFLELTKESRLRVGVQDFGKKETIYLKTDKILYFKIVEEKGADE